MKNLYFSRSSGIGTLLDEDLDFEDFGAFETSESSVFSEILRGARGNSITAGITLGEPAEPGLLQFFHFVIII